MVGVWDKDPNSIAKKVFNVIKVIKGNTTRMGEKESYVESLIL